MQVYFVFDFLGVEIGYVFFQYEFLDVVFGVCLDDGDIGYWFIGDLYFVVVYYLVVVIVYGLGFYCCWV